MDEKKLMQTLRARLTDARLVHSVNVAESAHALAERWGADPEKAHWAGLAHDVCKCDSVDKMTNILTRAGYDFLDCERGNAKLLHAPAGATFLRESGLCADDDILDAVRYHTTGRAGMSLLEKVVFMADLVSADRDYPDVETVRQMTFSDLDGALNYALAFIKAQLERRGEAIHPNSVVRDED
ncbi:MAG: bis(5'-nucleosyl)-tetraphosphatase (symmetrical) YqeK [Oscillospiraceae bacterium]|jgi:nicotinate-nucleotide adenylyltransferase|nr:bis(5'-nucleosyl)-tetraphosphatase (symmetrical) YqeK [Oscillospiraceae bacterium]